MPPETILSFSPANAGTSAALKSGPEAAAAPAEPFIVDVDFCRIEHGIGSKLNPMSDADLERKFAGLAEPVVGATRTRELIRKTWDVGGLADAGELARAAA